MKHSFALCKVGRIANLYTCRIIVRATKYVFNWPIRSPTDVNAFVHANPKAGLVVDEYFLAL